MNKSVESLYAGYTSTFMTLSKYVFFINNIDNQLDVTITVY